MMTQTSQEQRRPRIKLRGSIVLLVVVLIAALLAYVGVTHTFAAQPTATLQPQPTSVHIVRVPGNEPQFHIAPLDRTITDTSQVQHLYQTVLHLPGRFIGGGACAGESEAYTLTFSRNSQEILTMQAHTGLYWAVVLDRGNPTDTGTFLYRQATRAFWSELAHMLGIPYSDVEPSA